MKKQKTALVTGASNGIGLETSLALAEKGYSVILLCRNKQRGEAALKYIQTESKNQNVSLMLCDLGDMNDIRRFCTDFIKKNISLDILINNAGVLNLKRKETKDGLEEHFGVCHIGHFLLTNLLLNSMSQKARIIMVGSVAYKIGNIDFDDIAMTKNYSVVRAYSRAKLCNLLFTKELSRRLNNTNITINCVHPRAVVTNIGSSRKNGKFGIGKTRLIAGKILAPFVKSPKQGAATTIYAATSKKCAAKSGMYFSDCKPRSISKRASNIALAKKLWTLSEQLTKLNKQAN